MRLHTQPSRGSNVRFVCYLFAPLAALVQMCGHEENSITASRNSISHVDLKRMHLNTSCNTVLAIGAPAHTMKIHRASSILELFTEIAENLFDIFSIGATALEDRTPEADARNLRYDLQRISNDFRKVMSGIGSGTFTE